jgi:trans-aconitate methyltransferase
VGEPVFRDEPLLAIVAHVQARIAAGDAVIGFAVLDPDHGRGHFAGERLEIHGRVHVHRPWRVWTELADRLGLRMVTPRAIDGALVRVAFEPLGANAQRPGAGAADGDRVERYGTASAFARLDKAELPGFVIDLADAVARAQLPPWARVLDLGVNDGDELALLVALAPALANASFVGVDHSASAVAAAQARFPTARLVCADVAELGAHDLGRFELIVSIGTLQSPSVDDRALLRRLVQDHLAPTGAIILGVPNCRYQDSELVHGARVKNLRQPELGLVVKDVAFYRKYLQQHACRVFVTGDHYLFVTGVRGANSG